jgi:hypothetical protein
MCSPFPAGAREKYLRLDPEPRAIRNFVEDCSRVSERSENISRRSGSSRDRSFATGSPTKGGRRWLTFTMRGGA